MRDRQKEWLDKKALINKRCEYCGKGPITPDATHCVKCSHKAPGRKRPDGPPRHAPGAGGPKVHNRWTDEMILSSIQDWALVRGDTPTANDAMDTTNRDRLPSLPTIRKHFGSWNAAIAAAGFEPRPSGQIRTATRSNKEWNKSSRQMVTAGRTDVPAIHIHSRHPDALKAPAKGRLGPMYPSDD